MNQWNQGPQGPQGYQGQQTPMNPWGQPGMPQGQAQPFQGQPAMGQPAMAPQAQMVSIAPANVPGSRRYDFQITLNDVKEKIDNGVMKGYILVYDFKVVSGEYIGQSVRQWFPSYAATSRIRELFRVCGKPLHQQQGPQGVSEALDPASISGAMVNAQLDYDKNDMARISDLKLIPQGQPVQVQGQPGSQGPGQAPPF